MSSLTNLSVADWEAEIESAIRYRNECGVESSWADNEALFYHVHDDCRTPAPNLVASTGDAMLSELCVPKPYIGIKAQRSDDVRRAPLVETVDNRLLSDLDIPAKGDAAILSAFLYAVGIVKIGYDSIHGWDPEADMGGSMGETGQSLTQFDKKGNRIEFSSAKPGMPWVETVLPHDFLVPWGTREIDTAPWTCQRQVRHVEDIKKDWKYSNTGSLQPTMSMEDWTKSYTTVMQPSRFGASVNVGRDGGRGDVQYVELWEIHDARTHRVIVIATGHGEFLRNDPDVIAAAIGGHPFVSMSFVPRARTFWTTPDAFYLKDVQEERTDIARQNKKQRRVGVAKWMVKEGTFDPAEMTKLTSARVGAIATAKAHANLQTDVSPFPQQSNQQLWMEGDRVEQSAKTTVGFSPNQVGNFAGGRHSATESAIVSQAAGVRMGRRENMVRRFYIGMFRKINSVIFHLWRAPQQILYVGHDGAAQWQTFNGLGLGGDYGLDVDFSDDGGESRAARQQRAMMMLQSIAMPFMDPAGVVRYAVRAFNDPDVTLCFNPAFLQGAMLGQPMQPQGSPGLAPPTQGQGQAAGLLGFQSGAGGPGAGPLPAISAQQPHIGARGGQTAKTAGV